MTTDPYSIGWGMTRIRYKRVFWHCYIITEEEPYGMGDSVRFLATHRYLKWSPKLTKRLKTTATDQEFISCNR